MERKQICKYCDKVALFLLTGKSYCLIDRHEVNFNLTKCQNFAEDKVKNVPA